MQSFARLFILVGIIFLALAAYDEYCGIATVRGSFRYMGKHVAAKADNPEDFRGLMTYQWIRGSLVVIAGMVLLHICRRADSLDPLTPHEGNDNEIDEWESTPDEDRHKR